jgi:hypothetical protein
MERVVHMRKWADPRIFLWGNMRWIYTCDAESGKRAGRGGSGISSMGREQEMERVIHCAESGGYKDSKHLFIVFLFVGGGGQELDRMLLFCRDADSEPGQF